MDDLLKAEEQYRNHYRRIAHVDREAGKYPQPTARAQRLPHLRPALAKALLVLAMRLSPAPSPAATPKS